MSMRAIFAKNKTRTLGFGLRQVRAMQTVTLPDLDYDFSALEPTINGEIMQIHHQKHHRAYVTNYNKALEQLEEAISKGDSSKVVSLQGAIKFNGGGHVNHSIFWKNLAPTKIAIDIEICWLLEPAGPNFLQNNPIFQPNMSNLPQFMSYRASKEERLEPINILDQFSSPRFHHLPPSIQTSPHLSQKNTGSRITQHHPYAQHQIYPYHPTTNSTVKLQLAPPVAAPRNSPTGQLTIFYGTNVYVYDEIPVDKAQEIIYIANKNSKVAENVKNNDAQPLQPSEEVQDFNITVSETNVVNSNFSDFSSLLSAHSTTTDVADATASGRGTSRTMNQPNSSIPMSRAVPLARRASLARFLEKRKERMINDVNPYLNGKLGGGPSFEKSLLRGGEQRQSWCADKWKDCTVNRGMVVPNAKLEI